MWYPAGGDAFYRALFPPWLEVLGFGDRAWVLDPLNNLSHGYEVYIVVALEDLIDPV